MRPLFSRRLAGPEKQADERQSHQRGLGEAGHVRRGQVTILVWFQTGSVCHHVSDVCLFLHTMEEVCHWTLGHNGHIFTSVGFRRKRHSRLLVVGVAFCREREEMESAVVGC